MLYVEFFTFLQSGDSLLATNILTPRSSLTALLVVLPTTVEIHQQSTPCGVTQLIQIPDGVIVMYHCVVEVSYIHTYKCMLRLLLIANRHYHNWQSIS